MEIVLHSLSGILTVLLIIGTGFALDRRGWFSESGVSLISRLVNTVCLPGYMLANMVARFSGSDLIEMGRGAGVPMLSMLLGLFAAKVLAGILKIPKERKGIFIDCVTFSSVIFQGLPLVLALFGEEGLPYIMIYYIANTVLFWTIGVREAALSSGRDVPLISRRSLKIILNPPLIGLLLGIILVMLNLKLPEPLYRSLYYIGSMTSPLAMLFIGIAMSRTAWEEIKIDFQTSVAMLGRFFICPLILYLMLPFFNVNETMGRVFVICAALPSVTNLSVVLKEYGGDYKYAAMLVTVSTCLSAAVVPFYMWLIH